MLPRDLRRADGGLGARRTGLHADVGVDVAVAAVLARPLWMSPVRSTLSTRWAGKSGRHGIAMRPHVPRPSVPRQPAAARERAGSECSAAEALLGSGHPLVRVLGRLETAREQLVTVTAVQGAGLVFFAGDWAFGLSVAIAAAAVQAGLAFRIATLRMEQHGLCLTLIVKAGSRLPLPCVEQTCGQLLQGRTAERLASSVDEMVATARRPPSLPAARPLTDVRVIRATAPELAEVAALLRSDPTVRGVALVERLLTGPNTPLYGNDVEPLRQELRRARYLLTRDGEGDRPR